MSRAREIHQSEPRGDAPKPEGEISRRELLRRLSPLGKVELDSSRCTGCGLCAVECPTGALVISSGEEADAFKLIFKHGNCVACGLCVEICPEKCLRMERVIELDKVGSQSVLFEDTIIRCSGCGSPLGPKSMVDKMQARVTAAGQTLPLQFELCPDCKVRAQFSQLRM
ncbi:4Fe-4S dicluster domain-containing protein [Chloroflexota bacterium]